MGGGLESRCVGGVYLLMRELYPNIFMDELRKTMENLYQKFINQRSVPHCCNSNSLTLQSLNNCVRFTYSSLRVF